MEMRKKENYFLRFLIKTIPMKLTGKRMRDAVKSYSGITTSVTETNTVSVLTFLNVYTSCIFTVLYIQVYT